MIRPCNIICCNRKFFMTCTQCHPLRHSFILILVGVDSIFAVFRFTQSIRIWNERNRQVPTKMPCHLVDGVKKLSHFIITKLPFVFIATTFFYLSLNDKDNMLRIISSWVKDLVRSVVMVILFLLFACGYLYYRVHVFTIHPNPRSTCSITSDEASYSYLVHH